MLKDQKSFHINQIDSYLVKILNHTQTSQHTLVKLILMQSYNFNKLTFFCDHLVRVERFFLRNSEYSWTCSRRHCFKPLSLLQLALWGSLLEACYQQSKVSCIYELFFASISILSPIFKRLSHCSWETVTTVEPVLRGIVLLKWPVVKVLHLFPLNHSNFHLYQAQVSRACLYPSSIPTIRTKLRTIFQVNLIHVSLPRWEWVVFLSKITWSGLLWLKTRCLSSFIIYIYIFYGTCIKCLIRHPPRDLKIPQR